MFHLKGLRRILDLKTTFADRANTNLKVLELAESEIDRNGRTHGEKRVRLMSEAIRDRSEQELWNVLRLQNEGPRRQMTFRKETAKPPGVK